MRAVTLDTFGAAPAVRDDLPDPTVAADGLVVRVRASSVNPVDNAIAAGMLREMVDHDFPVVLGRDYAGTVEATGASVEGYAVGDEVFGFVLHANPTVHERSWAELIALTPEMQVAPKPASLDLAAAGVAPLAGIAALAAVDALALSEGETILIVGATGGVGSFAVQLAARAGATIIAPALPEDGDCRRWYGPRRSIPDASSASYHSRLRQLSIEIWPPFGAGRPERVGGESHHRGPRSRACSAPLGNNWMRLWPASRRRLERERSRRGERVHLDHRRAFF
jgi:NADPH2:quinone reductase